MVGDMSTSSSIASSPTMPALFIGHGSPMNALESNTFTQEWQRLGTALPKPRAILMVSAHWYIGESAVTAMPDPQTIHDFYGFPKELFEVQYPAAGSPEVALEVAEIVKPQQVNLDADTWGIDHGSWSVLVHMFPDADVPVVQLAIDASKTVDEHIALAQALEPLRRSGILIVASGNVVHNLRQVQWGYPDAAFDWNIDFDTTARDILVSDPGRVRDLTSHQAYDLAAPTPDHLIPLYYLAGVADAASQTVDQIFEGFSMGSLSMSSYILNGSDDG